VKFTESNIEQQAEAVIRARLEGIPVLKSIDVEREAPVESVSVDILVTVELPNTSQTLLVETKNSGQPRIARDAVNQLRVYLERFPGAYGILLAPYVSPTTASICKEAGIGYTPLARSESSSRCLPQRPSAY
jgi:RecB family endonuclease NucS